jgi:hypothetical protein
VIRGLLVALLLATCGSEPPDRAPRPAILGDVPGPLDALSRRHARLRRRLVRRGYAARVGLRRVFLLEERGVAFPLDLTVGRCSTFAALAGGAVRNLDAALYDGEGEEVARDAVPGEGALVHVCPQGPERRTAPHYLVLRALEGEGAALVAHFESDVGEGEGFDRVYESLLTPRVPSREVEERLAQIRQALVERGLEPLLAPPVENLAQDSMVRVPLDLSGDTCVVAVGRSDGGLRDIDLSLFDPAGAEVARDLGPDAEPTIEHCPEASGRFELELRSFEGAGAAGVIVLVGPRDDEDIEAPDLPVEPPEAVGDPAAALGLVVAPLLERGFGAPLYVSRDAILAPGEVRTHEVVVGPGCAVVVGAASQPGMDLDLYLADGNGRSIDRDTAVHATPQVRACRDRPTVLRVAVKGYGREGSYALALLRAPAEIASVRALRLEEATARYRIDNYEERARVEATGALRRDLVVEAGTCAVVAAAGGEGVEDLDLFLRRGDELVASDSGPAPFASVLRCAAEEDEQLTVELALYRGVGEVSLVLLAAVPEEAAEPAPSDAPGPTAP